MSEADCIVHEARLVALVWPQPTRAHGIGEVLTNFLFIVATLRRAWADERQREEASLCVSRHKVLVVAKCRIGQLKCVRKTEVEVKWVTCLQLQSSSVCRNGQVQVRVREEVRAGCDVAAQHVARGSH